MIYHVVTNTNEFFLLDNNKSDPLPFYSVLAASVHDMKNSLSLLVQSIESLGQHVPKELHTAHQYIGNTYYEALRLNTNLVQVLSLYRSGLSTIPLNIDECFVTNLFEDIVESNRYYYEQKNIQLSVECKTDLMWFLDSELVYLLLNDAVVNALRYGKQKVHISAGIEYSEASGDRLVVQIEDDGPGYPKSMLTEHIGEISHLKTKEGRTGLGLYFAHMIAEAHENKGNLGEISLKNGGSLGGSVFRLVLP